MSYTHQAINNVCLNVVYAWDLIHASQWLIRQSLITFICFVRNDTQCSEMADYRVLAGEPVHASCARKQSQVM